MPCNSDYMRQSGYEQRLQDTARLLVYVMQSLDLEVPQPIIETANTTYAKADFTANLCKLLKAMTPEQINKVIYDARNPTARRLADWWEAHQQADNERLRAIDETILAVESTPSFEAIRRGFELVSRHRGFGAARALRDSLFTTPIKLADMPVSDYPRVSTALVAALRELRKEEEAS